MRFSADVFFFEYWGKYIEKFMFIPYNLYENSLPFPMETFENLQMGALPCSYQQIPFGNSWPI